MGLAQNCEFCPFAMEMYGALRPSAEGCSQDTAARQRRCQPSRATQAGYASRPISRRTSAPSIKSCSVACLTVG
jgi:hypothetical protein